MSRRKQSNPKPLKPGEDSEWATNEEAVGSGGDMAAKCDVKTEQLSPLPPQRTSEPEERPPSATTATVTTAAASEPPPLIRLRLNPNLATDPARWSPASEQSSSPPQPHSQPQFPQLPSPTPPTIVAMSAATSSSSSSSSSSLSSLVTGTGEPGHNAVTITVPRAVQVFICNPCGIRFSSLSTLDAHQTYYCSRRPKKDSESDDVKVSNVESDDMVTGNDTDSRPSSVEPSAKSARTGKQYKCPHCMYSADKKVSLNRHMRIHATSPVSMQSPPCPPDTADPSTVDRYCQNCDIRFSNLRTYQAHKTHYCNTRHVVKPTPSSSPIANNPSPTNVPTYLALPTNPVIVVPYALVQNASVLSAISPEVGPSPPTDTACIVLSDGTLQPIAQALVPTNMIANNDNIQRENSQSPPEAYYSPPKKAEIVNHQEPKRPIVQSSSPLDLRLKRVAKSSLDSTDGEEEKENRRSDGNITDAEDIVCAPSIPCMILSPAPSPPSSGKKTPHQLHRGGVDGAPQPPVNGVIVQKPQAAAELYDSAERNGKFSMSNLLHVSNKLHQENVKQQQDTVNNNEMRFSPATLVQRFNPTVMHKPRHPAMLPGPVAPAPMQLPPVVVHRNEMQLNPATGLPYFTPEMLRLQSANQVDQPAHQFFLKQGTSRCESCNIVFCKYENYVAHKKHYCASRPPLQNHDAEDADAKTSPEGSPGPKPLVVCSPQSSKDSVSPTPVLKPPMIQFICSTCGVKFSSFDNLTTHQSFYCPNRLTASQDAMDKTLSKCPKCKVTIEGGNHHQCPAANCWKCPVCGVICPSASAAQKHLDSHNGIRAFVCTICQYKGNTLRGLRTHIRMHFNKRLIPDLMEEDYVSCVIDENSTSSATADPGAKTPTPSLQELEKSAPPSSSVNAAGKNAGAGPPDTDKNQLPPVRDQPVIVKQEPSNAAGSSDVSATGSPEPPGANQREHPGSGPGDRQTTPPQPSALSMAGGIKRPGMAAKYCKTCDISFNYLSTFIAHKKYYCKNNTEYKCNATENAKTATVT